jgi:hypothetical protein
MTCAWSAAPPASPHCVGGTSWRDQLPGTAVDQRTRDGPVSNRPSQLPSRPRPAAFETRKRTSACGCRDRRQGFPLPVAAELRDETRPGEKAVRLFGGQRQRVAIACIILRDPAMLLLDEVTSTLDAESELAVEQARSPSCAAALRWWVAHHSATVRKADRFLVMETGRMVVTGTHETLIEQSGSPRRWCRSVPRGPTAERRRSGAHRFGWSFRTS